MNPEETRLAQAVFEQVLTSARRLTNFETMQLVAAWKGYASFEQMSDGVRRHLADVGLAAVNVGVAQKRL